MKGGTSGVCTLARIIVANYVKDGVSDRKRNEARRDWRRAEGWTMREEEGMRLFRYSSER